MNMNSLKTSQDFVKSVLTKMISFDTQNPPGKTAALVAYLEELGQQLGITTKIIEYDEEKANIIWILGSGSKKILFSGHLDTVPVGSIAEWSFDPLTAVELENNFIGGRGTADMKGGVASILGVFHTMKDRIDDFDVQLIYLGTSDEETTMEGARRIPDEYVKNADILIVTEATDMKVGIAEKGAYWLKVIVKGKAAHGSQPWEGINAIIKSVELSKEVAGILEADVNHPLLGKSTFNLGKLHGGTKTNIVPERAEMEWDIRLVPNLDKKAFLQRLEQLFAEYRNKHGVKVETSVIHDIPALECRNVNHPFIQYLKQQTGDFIGLTYGTDAAALLQKDPNVPFIIFGPGDPRIIHKHDEKISLAQVVQASDLLIDAIRKSYSSKYDT